MEGNDSRAITRNDVFSASSIRDICNVFVLARLRKFSDNSPQSNAETAHTDIAGAESLQRNPGLLCTRIYVLLEFLVFSHR